jgi:hypothetical protein
MLPKCQYEAGDVKMVEGGKTLPNGHAFIGTLLSVVPGDFEMLATIDTDRKIPTTLRLPETVYINRIEYLTTEAMPPLVGKLITVYSLGGKHCVKEGGIR